MQRITADTSAPARRPRSAPVELAPNTPWALARLVIILGLLQAGASGCGGGGGPTVVVDVSGSPSGALALRFSATLAGQAVRKAEDLPADVRQAQYPLPVGASGTFAVDVRAIGADGCAAASGRGEVAVSGSGRLTVSVSLQNNNPSLCTVEVATQGDGVIASNPTGLSCGAQCRLDAPSGSRITLSVTPGARSSFAGWSGACAGVGLCDLTVTRPLSAQARFVPQLCTGKVCWENPLPFDVNLNAIWGFSSDNLWAVGDSGQILHWDGTVWALTSSGTSRNLSSVWGASPTDVWAVGDAGTLLHFDGTSWTTTPTPGGSTANLSVVRGSSASDVWVVGMMGTIFRYNGSTWMTQPGGPVGQLIGLFVAPDGTAFVSNAAGQLQRYSGGTFSAIATSGGAIYGMSGLSASSVLLGGDVNVVGTYDGQLYRALPAYPAAGQLHGAYLRAVRDGWLVGIDGAVLHYDGTTLVRHPVPSTLFLNGVHAVSENDVWVVGARGTILHFDGSSWQAYGRAAEPGAGVLNAISGTGPKDLWAVGSVNTVLHYTGQAWLPVATGQPATAEYRAVYAASASEVWVAGYNTATGLPVVLRWNGTSFGSESVPVAAVLNAVAGAGPGSVYMVGNSSAFLRWTGSALVGVGVPVSSNLLSVSVAGNGEVWAGGSPIPDPMNATVTIACVLRQTGTGAATVLRGVPNSTLYAASAAGMEVLFAGSDSLGRSVIQRINNGTYDRAIDLSPNPLPRGLANLGGGDVWLVGNAGLLLHATDGATFGSLGGQTVQSLLGVVAFPSQAVAVGAGRAILRASP